jgi:hypothetical protein
MESADFAPSEVVVGFNVQFNVPEAKFFLVNVLEGRLS